jgi:hypothetical protein
MRIFYCIRRFWEIPKLEKKLFAYGVLLSLVLIPFLEFIPLKYYWPLMTRRNDKINEESSSEYGIKILKKTIKRIVGISPVKLNCLVKSILFKILSNSLDLNYDISFSAIKYDNGSLVAHAYIKSGNKIVYLANQQFNKITPLTVYINGRN